MKNTALILFALLLQAPAAQAAISCRSTSAIDAQAQTCEDNESFADAGVECLENLQELVNKKAKEAAAAMGAANTKNVGDEVNKQTNTFQGSLEDYQISQDALNQLLLDAQATKAMVAEYLKDLYLPDGFEIVENTDNDIDGFVSQFPCFAENEETLKWVGEDVDKIISDLTKAKNAAAKKGGTSESRHGSMDSDPASGPKAKATKGKGGSTGQRSGKSQRSTSDVTGVEQDMKGNEIRK